MSKMQLRGLVISRKVGEIISVNHGELKIQISEIKGRFVRMIFEAARDVKIDRAEKIENNTCISASTKTTI